MVYIIVDKKKKKKKIYVIFRVWVLYENTSMFFVLLFNMQNIYNCEDIIYYVGKYYLEFQSKTRRLNRK